VRHSKPLILLAFAACLGSGRAAAQTAADFMAEGNQLVRSGVYRTALVRYREAAAAGLDTPLLHYNIGVVHYELGNFAESADEFALAAAEPTLGALASYNRGLALRAAGDSSSARAAFQAAAETADDRDLRRLAESAAAEPVAAAPPPSAARRQRVAEPEPRIGALHLSVAARMGQDDNIYRGPS
jgi:tetratricopeptide (TPR) repeat protein